MGQYYDLILFKQKKKINNGGMNKQHKSLNFF